VSVPDDWEPDAFAPFYDGAEGVHIPLQGRFKDEWMDNLRIKFLELGRGLSAATKRNVDGGRHEEMWFNDGTKDQVRLMIFGAPTGLVIVLGMPDGGDAGAEAAYRTAVDYATESTGRRRESVAWEATICPVPVGRGPRPMGLRIAATEFRDLSISNWGSMHTEDVPTWFPGGAGIDTSFTMFWPIRVTGAVSCYSWEKDGAEVTAPRLRYLAELLTLAFNCPMAVRVGPYEAAVRAGERTIWWSQAFALQPSGRTIPGASSCRDPKLRSLVGLLTLWTT
jgi:hypothetical protein